MAVPNCFGIRSKKPAEIRKTLLSIFSDVSTGQDGSRVQQVWPYLLEASCEGRLDGGKLFCSYVTMGNLRNAWVKGEEDLMWGR